MRRRPLSLREVGRGRRHSRKARAATVARHVGYLLATKFYVPRPRTGLVHRPSLTHRLLGGTESKLTLISAPAGFGKSTLLAEWLAAPTDGSLTAWLSLDSGDDHPSRFWPHLIAALQTAVPGVGATSLALLESADRSIETILAPLLNELDEQSSDIVLVLDDYHVIDSQEIQIGMSFVLDHLPAHVRLVIATRVDPALPLARIRARGELIEIRASDLRFTSDEAVAYFNGVMGLGLTDADVAALEGRTEGGSQRCTSPGCRCRGATTPPASSRALRATTATSSTTSSKRSSSASPNASGRSCSRHRSSAA